MFRDIALDHKGAPLRVQSHREPVQRDLDHRLADALDLPEMVAQRLIVGNQEKALVFVLQAPPSFSRAPA